MAECRDKWLALLGAVISIRITENVEICRLAEEVLVSQCILLVI